MSNRNYPILQKKPKLEERQELCPPHWMSNLIQTDQVLRTMVLLKVTSHCWSTFSWYTLLGIEDYFFQYLQPSWGGHLNMARNNGIFSDDICLLWVWLINGCTKRLILNIAKRLHLIDFQEARIFNKAWRPHTWSEKLPRGSEIQPGCPKRNGRTILP